MSFSIYYRLKIAADDWGLKLDSIETTSLYSPTNLMKIPSLAERAKHLFTPLKVRRVKFRQPALLQARVMCSAIFSSVQQF
jgi:hypothetical protein